MSYEVSQEGDITDSLKAENAAQNGISFKFLVCSGDVSNKREFHRTNETLIVTLRYEVAVQRAKGASIHSLVRERMG
jgi:hypothetical protein